MKNFFTVAGLILFLAAGARTQTTNALSDAEIQGGSLVRQILDQTPVTNFTQNGVLKIRSKQGDTTNVRVSFQTVVTPEDWQTIYEASPSANDVPHTRLRIIHVHEGLNRYFLTEDHNSLTNPSPLDSTSLSGNETMLSFAGSDFWLADLGLEFFHWPQQKVLKHEVRRSRGCAVLESTNPSPATNGYSRVISWIDNESLGIIHAEAYDAQSKLLKEFDPKSFKKVNGQWELQEMEIRNVQTGSRTRLEFDLPAR